MTFSLTRSFPLSSVRIQGVYIWATSIVLARWIVSQAQMLSKKRVLELGAGCGLPSVAALRFSDLEYLHATDLFDHSLKNLRHNLEGACPGGEGKVRRHTQTQKRVRTYTCTYACTHREVLLKGRTVKGKIQVREHT